MLIQLLHHTTCAALHCIGMILELSPVSIIWAVAHLVVLPLLLRMEPALFICPHVLYLIHR